MFSLWPDDKVIDLPRGARWPCLSGDSGLCTASTPRTSCCSYCRAGGGEKPNSMSYRGSGGKLYACKDLTDYQCSPQIPELRSVFFTRNTSIYSLTSGAVQMMAVCICDALFRTSPDSVRSNRNLPHQHWSLYHPEDKRCLETLHL